MDGIPEVQQGLAHCLAVTANRDAGDGKIRDLAAALSRAGGDAGVAAALCRELPGCDEPSLCLVGFDLPGIQGRIFDTSKRPVIRATSEMISRACRQVSQKLEEAVGLPPVCVIFSGGGQGVVLAPASRATAVEEAIAAGFEQNNLTGLACTHLCFRPMEIIEAGGGLPAEQAEVLGIAGMPPMALLRQRLGAKLEAARPPAFSAKIDAGSERCAWCRTREAKEGSRAPDQQLICPDCAERYRFAKGLKDGEAEDFAAIVEGFKPKAPRTQSLAILYADGNNIGGVIEKLATLEQFQTFSRALDRAVQDGVEQVGRSFDRLREGKHFIKLLVGGDDAMLLLPGPVALDFACELCQHVERAFTPGDEVSGQDLWRAFPKDSPAREVVEQVGLSAGVVFAAPSFPIRMMLRYASECLKTAKRRAHGEKDEPKARSYVDFACVDKGAHVGTALDEDRTLRLSTELHGKPARLTERPYSLAEARLLLEEVRLLQAMPTSQVYDLRALLLDTPESGSLQVEYQLARSTAWRRFCRELSATHQKSAVRYLFDSPKQGAGLATWRRRKEGGPLATPLLDWLELRPRIHDGGRKEAGR